MKQCHKSEMIQTNLSSPMKLACNQYMTVKVTMRFVCLCLPILHLNSLHVHLEKPQAEVLSAAQAWQNKYQMEISKYYKDSLLSNNGQVYNHGTHGTRYVKCKIYSKLH